MLQPDPAALLRTLNRHCTQALEAAAGLSLSRGHYEVTVEHLLSQLLVDPNADLHLICHRYGVDDGRLQAALQRQLEVQRGGNSGRPVFSPLLLAWLRDAWLLGSTELRLPVLRSGVLLAMLIQEPYSYTTGSFVELLEPLPRDELRRQLLALTRGSIEEELTGVGGPTSSPAGTAGAGRPEGAASGPHSRGPETALGRFTTDFTAEARAGRLDPVIGRDAEIRQCIDILARRRKNNPIIVGEAGVGKTALVEGIAQRIVAEEVPRPLANVDLLGLDLGLLQAGASVKGEFENRLKGVIEEVKASPRPIILFIDEAHTLIGAGGAAGGGDAANLLKPALARGELRTVAATTWAEYKKYFEKDAALTRRFQLVKVDEPGEDNAVAMMRGLAPHYEESHGVRIRDDGVVAAVELSSRYLSGRQLPDKAVDLIDTCAARVSIAQGAKPARLEDLEHRQHVLEREQTALAREVAEGRPQGPRLAEIELALAETRSAHVALSARWEQERKLVGEVLRLREQLAPPKDVAPGAAPAAATPPPSVGAPTASQAPALPASATPLAADDEALEAATTGRFAAAELRPALEAAEQELASVQGKDPLVPVEVTPDLVAAVVADWTGIPVGKMVRDQASVLLALEQRLGERIKGQDHALRSLGEGIRSAKLGLANPRAPIGVFLLVGPSGVGKTETGLALADLLFGGERFLVTINMSEFQEKHTVSRLIGSPPGYVGYGEGGVLTEAVRQRPYSAVILDEVEKADPEVMNIFYQVFDKGMLADGEGRVIDFRNTVLLMTSNLGSQRMTEMCMQVPPPSRQQVTDAIRPELVRHFKPALLARMTVVPFFPLSANAMRAIVTLKLDQLRARMQQTHRLALSIDSAVEQQILERCAEVETGARNIDHILSRTLLPLISRALLDRMAQGPLPGAMTLTLQDGDFALSFVEAEPEAEATPTPVAAP
ncbi:MAG: type VI secretion system ATPase TssH [Proteobacteria bacterium]|nr:type VI secretion system ATPase TssH [Pseudomonadota bacterium]